MAPVICIGGKNQIAVDGLRLVLDRYPDARLCYIPAREDEGIDTWQPSLIRHAELWGVPRARLADLYGEPDLVFLSLEFSDLLRTRRFASPRLYNIHFSLLPRYKGMYTSAHPLLNGERESGVTLHRIDDGIDTGDIIDQRSFEIAASDTARELYGKYLAHAFAMLADNLDDLVAGRAAARPQPAEGASYYPKGSIDYANVVIDLNRTAWEAHNQFRAFSFREYQMPRFQGWSILRSEILPSRSPPRSAGKVLAETDEAFVIATIDYDLRLVKDYGPPLWAACEAGDLDAIDRCLAFVDDIDWRNRQGWNGLILAAYNGRLEAVKRLIDRGASINATNYKGTTVLMYALSQYELSGDAGIFRHIHGLGPDLDFRDNHGKTVADYIAERDLTVLARIMAGQED